MTSALDTGERVQCRRPSNRHRVPSYNVLVQASDGRPSDATIRARGPDVRGPVWVHPALQ